MKFYPYDARKGVSDEHIKFILHKKKGEINCNCGNFFWQDEKVISDCDLFSSKYIHPEVYTLIIKNASIINKAPSTSRYFPIFFDNKYLWNWLSNDAKNKYQNRNIFVVDENDCIILNNSLYHVHINDTCVLLPLFSNIDHLYRESLPGLVTLKNIGYKLNSLKYITHYVDDRILKFLSIIGIERDNIIIMQNRFIYNIDNFIVPCFSSFGHLHTPSRYSLGLKNIYKLRSKPKRNLYISRKNASRRSVLNDTFLQCKLKKLDFQIIDPGDLSIQEQINLFSEAKLIVGLHGMGLANFLFSESSCCLLEFMPKGWTRNSYFRVAQIKNSNYYCLFVNNIDKRFELTAEGCNVLIDIEKTIQLIDFIKRKI